MNAASKLSMLTAQMEQDSDSEDDVLANLGLNIGSDGEVDINLSDSEPFEASVASVASAAYVATPRSAVSAFSDDGEVSSSRGDDDYSGEWERGRGKWDSTVHRHERSADESDHLIESLGNEDDERIARVAAAQPSWARDSAQLRNLQRVDTSRSSAGGGGYSDEDFEEDGSPLASARSARASAAAAGRAPYRRAAAASPSGSSAGGSSPRRSDIDIVSAGSSYTSGLGDEDDVDLCSDDNVGVNMHGSDAEERLARAPFAALALKRAGGGSGGSASSGGEGQRSGSGNVGGNTTPSRRMVDSVDGDYSDEGSVSVASTPMTARSSHSRGNGGGHRDSAYGDDTDFEDTTMGHSSIANSPANAAMSNARSTQQRLSAATSPAARSLAASRSYADDSFASEYSSARSPAAAAAAGAAASAPTPAATAPPPQQTTAPQPQPSPPRYRQQQHQQRRPHHHQPVAWDGTTNEMGTQCDLLHAPALTLGGGVEASGASSSQRGENRQWQQQSANSGAQPPLPPPIAVLPPAFKSVLQLQLEQQREAVAAALSLHQQALAGRNPHVVLPLGVATARGLRSALQSQPQPSAVEPPTVYARSYSVPSREAQGESSARQEGQRTCKRNPPHTVILTPLSFFLSPPPPTHAAVQRYSASVAAAAAGYKDQVAALRQRIAAANSRAKAAQNAGPTRTYTSLAQTQNFLAQSRARAM